MSKNTWFILGGLVILYIWSQSQPSGAQVSPALNTALTQLQTQAQASNSGETIAMNPIQTTLIAPTPIA